jgi:hypothetical protein
MKAMITIIAILTASILGKAEPTIPPIEQMIKNQICYPDDAKMNNEEGMVLVSFKVNEEGHVIVQETNASNEKLKNYVLGKLTELILPGYSTNEEFNMKFVFRLL